MKAHRLPVALGLLAALALGGALVSACCALRHNCPSPGKVVTDCGGPLVKQVEANLGAAITIILESGNWQAGIDSLVAQLEADAVADAVGVMSCILSHLMAKPAVGVPKMPMLSPAQLSHAKAWVGLHAVKK